MSARTSGCSEPRSSDGAITDITRRSMLGYLGAGAALAVVGGGITGCGDGEAGTVPAPGEQRRNEARDIRREAAEMAYSAPISPHVDNGDEDLYPNRIGNYSKALPHDERGEVDPAAYDALLEATRTRTADAFAAIPLGGTVKLANPQAGLAFDLMGPDCGAVPQAPPPTFASAQIAGEMVELYWMALARDVAFADYDTDPTVAAACSDLSNLSDFRGPKQSGRVTPATIFRGSTPGDLVGPHVSQFLLRDFGAGPLSVSQRLISPVAGSDFMTTYAEWLAIQNGAAATERAQVDPVPRHVRNLRDLARYVELDYSFEAFLHAALILQQLKVPVQSGNPYAASTNQSGFATWGGPHLLDLVASAANRALKAVWFQKWFVHRRVRPEEYAGRVDLTVRRAADYPVDGEVIAAEARHRVESRFGSSLLPMAYPGGCPTHPSYGAGHNAIAGACATILKAWFQESFVVPDPVVPDAEGTALVPYTGADAGEMTVRNELDKLAGNFTQARDGAGVHWRSDGPTSLELGEAVAIGILQEQQITFNESGSFTITKFDGTTVTI